MLYGALIGVDRYLRIKHFGDFRNFWTTRVVLKSTCTAIILAFFEEVLVLAHIRCSCDRCNNLASNSDYPNNKYA